SLIIFRLTRSGQSPAAPLQVLPQAKIPERRDGSRSLKEVVSQGAQITRRHKRSLMQAANTGRLEASWSSTPESADSIIFKNLRTLVARSRSAYLDGDYPKQ